MHVPIVLRRNVLGFRINSVVLVPDDYTEYSAPPLDGTNCGQLVHTVQLMLNVVSVLGCKRCPDPMFLQVSSYLVGHGVPAPW